MTANPSSPIAALKRAPLFEGVPAGLIERIGARAAVRSVPAGHMIMNGEDRTTDVLFILDGRIRVSIHGPDGGHARILSDFHAGDFVGELAAIDGEPRSARVEALTRTSFCAVPAGEFLAAVTGCPLVGLRVLRMLTARIRTQNQTLLQGTALPARLRIAAELLRIARPRGDGTLVISPPPRQQELADRVGARRETVSREIGALADAGLVQRTRVAMVLRQPGALREMVEGG